MIAKLQRSYSKRGEQLTEGFESCSLVAYYDLKGVLTIGWGHTGSVYPGQTITREQADELLCCDVATAVNAVNKFVTIPLTQNEFDALVDFVFNIGVTAFVSSHCLAYLNSSHFDLAEVEFLKWDHASGKVVSGLLRRRTAERNLFEEHDAVA
jgi:lysozyme